MNTQFSYDNLMPYATSFFAAAGSILPVYPDLEAKSLQQLGEHNIPPINFKNWAKEGLKLAPVVGFIIAAQMEANQKVDNFWKSKFFDPTLLNVLTTIGSPAVVGFGFSPFLTIFNGKTMKMTAMQSLQMLFGRAGLKMCMAIALQETAFVAGIAAGKQIKKLSDNNAITYPATFAAGYIGSLAGHPFNTAVTRWLKKKPVEFSNQLWWGAARKARAIGCFALLYKIASENLNSKVMGGKHE